MAKKKKQTKNKKGQTPKAVAAATAKKTEKTVEKAVPKAPSSDFFYDTLGNKSSYLIAGLLVLLGFVVYGTFWTTDNVFLFKDIGSDTINVFYTTYYWNAKVWAEEGIFPTWSFASGMGQDIMPGSVGDPFLWLLYLMGKDAILEGIGYIEGLKVILSGLVFFAYLRTLKLEPLAAVTGGLIYAFSGFMMIGSGWYVFTIEGLYFALLLLGFERFLLQDKWLLFPVALMLVALLQPLDVYIMAILIGTYGTVRILEVNNLDWGDLFKKYAQLIGLGVLALLMGSIFLMPTLNLMVNSPRVLGESSFFDTLQSESMFSFANTNLWETTKARLLSTNLLVDDSFAFRGDKNYFEAPAIYCGLSMLLLLPQAFVHLSKLSRVLYGILLTVYLLPLCFPFLRYSFWLFSGDYFRIYSLFVVFILLYLGVKSIDAIRREGKVNWIALGIGVVLSFGLLFSISNTELVQVNESSRQVLAMFLAVYTLVIAAWGMNAFRSMARIAFLVLVLVELVVVAKPTLNNRSIAKKSEFTTQKVGYNDYTMEAVQHIQSIDPSFHRIEKYYQSSLAIHGSTNDAKVQGYMGSKSYNSFNQLNYVRFLGALDVINEKDENQTRWLQGVTSRQLLTTLASTRYILSKMGKDKPVGVGYQHIGDFGDVSVFQNQYFLPLGFTYDKFLSRTAFDRIKKDNVSKDIALLKAVVLDEEQLAEMTGLTVLDTNVIQPQFYSEQALATDVNARKAEAFELTSFKNAHLTGKITLQQPKMLFFTIPFDAGWSATVNGETMKLQQANIGFSGLMLPAGTHEIELVYNTPYYSTGTWVSLLGLLLFGGLCFWRREQEFGKEEEPLEV